MGSTSLTLNLEQITSINADVISSKESIHNTLAMIDSDFADLSSNVTGSNVNNLINVIRENVSGIDRKTALAFEELTSFLNSQVKNYEDLYQSALAMLMEAFSFIEQNF